jgi:hypothetical protein
VRVQLMGAKMNTNPHPSGDLKSKPELPSIAFV